jgi:hypothetical protein
MIVMRLNALRDDTKHYSIRVTIAMRYEQSTLSNDARNNVELKLLRLVARMSHVLHMLCVCL